MKTDQELNIVEYPEISGKTLKNVNKDGNTLFFEFTDGSSFIVSPKPFPDIEIGISDLFNMHKFPVTINDARFMPRHKSEERPDKNLIAGNLVMSYGKGLCLIWVFFTQSETLESIQLDTKYTTASTN